MLNKRRTAPSQRYGSCVRHGLAGRRCSIVDASRPTMPACRATSCGSAPVADDARAEAVGDHERVRHDEQEDAEGDRRGEHRARRRRVSLDRDERDVHRAVTRPASSSCWNKAWARAVAAASRPDVPATGDGGGGGVPAGVPGSAGVASNAPRIDPRARDQREARPLTTAPTLSPSNRARECGDRGARRPVASAGRSDVPEEAGGHDVWMLEGEAVSGVRDDLDLHVSDEA